MKEQISTNHAIGCFSFDDLCVFYDFENGKDLALKKDSIKRFEKYIHNLVEYFQTNYGDGVNEATIIEYLTIKDEIKNALYLASFYVHNDNIIFECAQYLFSTLSYKELDLDKRLPMLKRFTESISDSGIIRSLLEDDIILRIQRCNNGLDKVIEFEKSPIELEANAIKEWFNSYKSEKIKQSISDSKENVAKALWPFLESII